MLLTMDCLSCEYTPAEGRSTCLPAFTVRTLDDAVPVSGRRRMMSGQPMLAARGTQAPYMRRCLGSRSCRQQRTSARAQVGTLRQARCSLLPSQHWQQASLLTWVPRLFAPVAQHSHFGGGIGWSGDGCAACTTLLLMQRLSTDTCRYQSILLCTSDHSPKTKLL